MTRNDRRARLIPPTTLDELIPQDHVCRVIEAFVGRLDMAKLGFVRSELAETRDADTDFAERARMLIKRGYKPKVAVELVKCPGWLGFQSSHFEPLERPQLM